MRFPRAVVLVLGLLLSAAATGCSTTLEDVIEMKDEGTSAVYTVTPDRAWQIASDILWEVAKADILEDRDGGRMYVRAGWGSDETLLAAWIDPTESPEETRVTMVSRRGNKAQIVNMLTEDQFHFRFGERVKNPERLRVPGGFRR